ncbi:2-succinyl-5-enolpyruvyl-6-hydroxy-3-cyclohexene-1-carboxylic-acid synthase [Rhabdochlamydiaceae symbiont of Dictyostelium giganteum]|uniref:2-succinyl-5-enolpyruvyl-6-hydroxy-3- cyclohexene-1-carboxylic-acid synthase n=1 Tax=Rhabdochlamydiaceae symbiont of Dictyostelium giganteum TaxID=3342349 RepID=UPI00384F425A
MKTSLSHHIIDSLVSCGVKTVCIAPGSRSSELTAAAVREEKLTKCVHFDERALAFYAYGVAKSSKCPVAIITTSGSAVGNLLPAVMEAFHERVPLILLTADRPTELKDVMANQSCDQLKLFGNYVKHFTHIPANHPSLSPEWVTSTVAYAVHTATSSPYGPVHMNCEFREPFFREEVLDLHTTPTRYEPPYLTLSQDTFKKWGKKLSSYQKGVIVCGSMPSSSSSILFFAKHLGWPVLADPMSGLRSEGMDDSPLIPYYNDLLKVLDSLQPDCILHFGDKIVSKPLEKWLATRTCSSYIVIANHPLRYDPQGIVSDRIQMDPYLFCEEVMPYLTPQASWVGKWKSLSHLVDPLMDELLVKPSEMGLIRYLHHKLPSHFSLYSSNSMPVRDIDRIFFPQKKTGTLFGQRGLSGIDGNIATAIGLKEGSQKPLVALIGDLAFLYDLSSLALIKSSLIPLILIVINNQGGGIFSFLPIAKEKDVFEPYVAAPHPYTFLHAAHLFDIPYLKLRDFSELDTIFQQEKTVIVELSSHREENFKHHEELSEKIQQTLLLSPSFQSLR